MIKPEDIINVGGRPTKYGKGVITKAVKYLEKCSAEKKTPFLEEFALQLGISEKTLTNWSTTHEDFTETYQMIKTVQKLDLKRRALANKIVPVIARLLLSAEHDVVERIKKEVSGVDGGAIQVEQTFSPEQEEKIRQGFLKVMEEATKR